MDNVFNKKLVKSDILGFIPIQQKIRKTNLNVEIDNEINAMPAKYKTTVKQAIKFEAIYNLPYKASKEKHEEVTNHFITTVRHEVYGKIIEELRNIQTEYMYGDEDNVMESIDNLIRELK